MESDKGRTADDSAVKEVRLQLEAFFHGRIDYHALDSALDAIFMACPEARETARMVVGGHPSGDPLMQGFVRALKIKLDLDPAAAGKSDIGPALPATRPRGSKPQGAHNAALPPMPATGPLPNSPTASGTVLNHRFVLESVIASGSRGEVFRASDRYQYDGGVYKRYFGIKILHERLRGSTDEINRFKRGFHFAQSLSHPNVINIFDLDFDRDAHIHYMTMELLDGSSLRSIMSELAGQPIPPSEARKLIDSLFNGLAYVHHRGLVHGDVHPQNIFITRQLESVLLNFGRAREQRGDADGASPPDLLPPVAGRRDAYASPEVQAGKLAEQRDDVFSLACVVYEILSGRQPFHQQVNARGWKQAAKLRRIKGLGRSQWQALQRALAPERRKRTASVVEFSRAFGALPVKEPARRYSLGWALLAVATAAAIAVLVMLINQPEPEPPTRVTAQIRDSGPATVTDVPPAAAPLDDTPQAGSANPSVEQAVPLVQDPGTPEVAPAADVVVPPPAATETPAVAENPGTPIHAAETSFALEDSRIRVRENGTIARLRILRTGNLQGTASVNWSAQAGTAAQDRDFGDLGRPTVIFADGEDSKWIFVPIVADVEPETEETFYVTLSQPSAGAVLGKVQRAAILIVDDD